MYEAMTGIDSGTLAASAGVVDKNLNSGAAAPWILVADDKTVYLFWGRYWNFGRLGLTTFSFGDHASLIVGDTWNAYLFNDVQAVLGTVDSKIYRARSFSGVAGFLASGLASFVTGFWGIGGPTTTLPGSTLVFLKPYLKAGVIYGWLRGILQPYQNKSVLPSHKSTIILPNGLAGMFIDAYVEDSNSQYIGKAVIQIEGPWQ
jgi:hypothetical protein